jgi:hypothetical protein
MNPKTVEERKNPALILAFSPRRRNSLFPRLAKIR